MLLSETSHTQRAVRAIYAEFRSVRFSVGLSRPVPDKFEVGNILGSFRGLSRGCGMVSRFPLYSFESPIVDSRLWQSQRIHMGVVQVGELAVTMVTVYLWPNAPLTSRRYVDNCEIIRAGVQLARSVSGPVILAGDFNAPLANFEDMKGLLHDGWADAALLDARRRGCEPEPTCQRATRHTFCVVNPLLVPGLRRSVVDFHEDLPTHAVLVTEFDLPCTNLRVFKWLTPKPLDKLPLDFGRLEKLADAVSVERWQVAVDRCLEEGNMDKAFENWSEIAETILLAAVDGEGNDVAKPAWSGRGRLFEPVLRAWAPPRFHTGRPGDFRLGLPSVALEARRWQKLVRQLEALVRKLRVGCRTQDSHSFSIEVQCIWRSIVGSPIRPRFPRWAFEAVGFEVHVSPSLAILEVLYQAAANHAQEVARRCWATKRECFLEQVDDSWKKQGGSFAFKMLKEQQHPPVIEMRVRTAVRLAPQRWLPDGKQWLRLLNASEFREGDKLQGCRECTILEVLEDSIRVDVRLSRKEAAELEKVEISLDPGVWSRAFFRGWKFYWQREAGLERGTPWKEMLDTIPRVLERPLGDIQFEDWKAALSRAKTTSMRGTCGWSVCELRSLPPCVVSPLLRIFKAIEVTATWPRQLQQWLVVLLRKEEGIPEWNSVRPISVASVVYRVWSKIRTRQMMEICQVHALPTVGPRLSTRSLWGFVADFVAEEMHAGKAPTGLVLDIVKAFNVLRRPLVCQVMCHFGIPESLVRAWLAGLDGMERHVLVMGNAYRADPEDRAATAGVPEGDPLSVVAMYCMCRFFALWVQSKGQVLPLTYADNWQVLADTVEPVVHVLPAVEEFLSRCALPISPEKCWLWSASKEGRKRLKSVTLGEDRIPVKLQSVDLGADLPYCKKRAAARRNQRISLGHRRLHRARAVPCSRWRNTRLILSGVWPQCLDGAETCLVPRSVYKRLRTPAGRVASLAKPGVSPWLACSVGAMQTVDPAFCLLVQRIRLFRLMWRDFPLARSRMRRGLISLRCGFGGVSHLLAKQLRSFEWMVVGLEAKDDFGRVFHLVETPLKAVKDVLETSWMDQVAANVAHRKDCSEVVHIDIQLSRTWMKYPLGEQALLLTQLTGVTFTRDCLSHAVGAEVSRACPLCGEEDSRLHRVRDCVAVADVRGPFLELLGGRSLPPHTWAYGLWDELPVLREWQAESCCLDWPFLVTSSCLERRFVFCDGSCLSPRCPKLAIAGGAVVLANPNGTHDLVWAGLLPGLAQSSYRAEVLALAVALSSFTCVTVFCDNLAVVKVATGLLKLPEEHRVSSLPPEHRDLWVFFCGVVAGRTWGACIVRWVKAHQDPQYLVGEARILALFNARVDAEAKKVVVERARHRMYRALFKDYNTAKEDAARLADLHVAIAQAFVEVERPKVGEWEPDGFVVVGCGARLDVISLRSQVHSGFGRRLHDWLCSLRWYPTCVAGWCGISALELLWQFVFDTGSLPPFWYDGKWCVVEDSALNSFVLPRMSQLYRTWVRALCAVDGLPAGDVDDVSGLPFARLGACGLSVGGRVPLHPVVVADLSSLFRRSGGVASLRFPSFW